MGHEDHLPTLTSLGLELAAGVSFGPAFIEYNFAWLISNHTLSPRINPLTSNDPGIREGTYFAPLGLNVGLSIPFIPVEPYVGLERGSFGFTAGAQTNYSGLAGKLGVNVRIVPGFGMRAEYRRLYVTSDDAGSLPDGLSTSFSAWFVGLVAGKF